MTGKDLVKRYFEALDAGDAAVIPELFSSDCEIHRPGLDQPLVGSEAVKVVVAMAHRIYEDFQTTVLDILEEAGCVVVRIRHEAVYRGEFRTRIGTFDATDKPTSWEAMALFRISRGKIIEERVVRDELGMLLDVGALDATV